MTAADFLRLVSPMLILGLAAGCSGDDTDAPADTATPDSMAASPLVQVRKPPPGLDIDRSTAVGQVVDEQGRLGWYPHEGGLMRYRVDIRFGLEPDTMPDGWHFGRVSAVATDSNNHVFVFQRGDVADGYGNSRVVKFDAYGNFIKAWGVPGTDPGEFDLVHSIAVDSQGDVYVSDRENNRIQIFDSEGNLLRIWTHLGSTQSIYITPDDQVWLITHRDNVEGVAYGSLAGRIMRVDIDSGEILGAMESPGHWIDVSHTGEIFIGSLTGNVFKWYGDWLDSSEAAQAERREAR